MGILTGVKIVEFEGLGPCPFCGMLLADLGAEVTLIERKGGGDPGGVGIFRRGKKSIELDLKDPKARDVALKIVSGADALIEGLRPGVMERLGLGPKECHALNPRLTYGRLTGWGQDGPLSQAAGHDLNYVALSGAGWIASQAGDAPTPPPTLVGDIGGGALYLAIGILAGLLDARQTGKGKVVDAAIVDGAAHMTTLLLSIRARDGGDETRGNSMIDGAPFYGVYICKDGRYISIGPLEPKFYTRLIEILGLENEACFATQYDQGSWPLARAHLTALFLSEPMQHWSELLYGTDVCFAPVLAPSEAATNPHMAARNVYREVDGILQAAAAPRFDGETPPDPPAPTAPNSGATVILREAGYTETEAAALYEAGIVSPAP